MEPNNDASSCRGKHSMGKCCYKPIALLVIFITCSLAIWFCLFNNSSADQEENITREQFAQAVDFFDNNKLDDARASFEKIVSLKDKHFSPLANMYITLILEANGDKKNAAERFLKIANDESSPTVIRYTATIHAAWILVDTMPYNEISKILQKLKNPSNPMHQAANEVLGIAALKSGNISLAKSIFEEIVKDKNAPTGIVNRSQIILANITATSEQEDKKILK
ncbi:hypothetical protein HUT03_03045 [Candidatus Liberibacter africanus]|uniref:Tetratricopeptide repeat-like domain-containing protein n=1 Tax=Candidatus Liberibacter africanus PTSAPSY TaxID=1277257 RepID=A0A0G3I4Q0_LIBAF|nr:hypothetical protein [Candidatus Liberibacter africanus]AKK20235.1 hypothetical protein G293_03035 [Candidatus Liberibacter africanus PTSAPSY]QTP64010.1 hypothetical protein HUT03_03045 [Candidatus Liberibacter africanus]